LLRLYFPHLLALIYVVFFIALGIAPVSREVWIAEVIPVVLIFLFLVFSFKRFRFSNLAYALMAIWIFWHTVGGHYTFANVPFQWFSDLIGSERNHFDRIGHFVIGFYAFAMAEWLLRKKYCGFWLALVFGLFFIMSVAAAYEIIEWWYAVAEGGEAGVEFLGSQGDIWDAQKDMLSDTLGALTSLILFALLRTDKSSTFDTR
jgi:putative membrane protein